MVPNLFLLPWFYQKNIRKQQNSNGNILKYNNAVTNVDFYTPIVCEYISINTDCSSVDSKYNKL